MPCSFDILGCQEGAQVALYLPLGHQKEIEFGEKVASFENNPN